MTIELNDYGFCLDSEWFYIALNWKMIITTIGFIVAYKIYKNRKNKYDF